MRKRIVVAVGISLTILLLSTAATGIVGQSADIYLFFIGIALACAGSLYFYRASGLDINRRLVMAVLACNALCALATVGGWMIISAQHARLMRACGLPGYAVAFVSLLFVYWNGGMAIVVSVHCAHLCSVSRPLKALIALLVYKGLDALLDAVGRLLPDSVYLLDSGMRFTNAPIDPGIGGGYSWTLGAVLAALLLAAVLAALSRRGGRGAERSAASDSPCANQPRQARHGESCAT